MSLNVFFECILLKFCLIPLCLFLSSFSVMGSSESTTYPTGRVSWIPPLLLQEPKCSKNTLYKKNSKQTKTIRIWICSSETTLHPAGHLSQSYASQAALSIMLGPRGNIPIWAAERGQQLWGKGALETAQEDNWFFLYYFFLVSKSRAASSAALLTCGCHVMSVVLSSQADWRLGRIWKYTLHVSCISCDCFTSELWCAGIKPSLWVFGGCFIVKPWPISSPHLAST